MLGGYFLEGNYLSLLDVESSRFLHNFYSLIALCTSIILKRKWLLF